jgi:hypothetical protein
MREEGDLLEKTKANEGGGGEFASTASKHVLAASRHPVFLEGMKSVLSKDSSQQGLVPKAHRGSGLYRSGLAHCCEHPA